VLGLFLQFFFDRHGKCSLVAGPDTPARVHHLIAARRLLLLSEG